MPPSRDRLVRPSRHTVRGTFFHRRYDAVDLLILMQMFLGVARNALRRIRCSSAEPQIWDFPVVSRHVYAHLSSNFGRVWYGAAHTWFVRVCHISEDFTLPHVVRTSCYTVHYATSLALGQHGPICVLATVVFAALMPCARSPANL